MTRRLIALSIAVLPLLGAGCSGTGGKGGSPQDPQVAVFQELTDILRGTTQPNGRGPAKLADLKGYQTMYPLGYEAVKSGEVVVIWGAGVKGEEQAGTGGEIVAYEKNAPTAGGYVLFNSGEVKKMSAEEFNAAPKAAGKK